jgi:hypothetical protein
MLPALPVVVDEFGAAWKIKAPLPVPVFPEGNVIHAVLAQAIQETPEATDTAALATPPPASKLTVAGEMTGGVPPAIDASKVLPGAAWKLGRSLTWLPAVNATQAPELTVVVSLPFPASAMMEVPW